MLNTFLNQTYILAAFNDEMSKKILFSKINKVLRSTTQGSIHRDLMKKYTFIILRTFAEYWSFSDEFSELNIRTIWLGPSVDFSWWLF